MDVVFVVHVDDVDLDSTTRGGRPSGFFCTRELLTVSLGALLTLFQSLLDKLVLKDDSRPLEGLLI